MEVTVVITQQGEEHRISSNETNFDFNKVNPLEVTTQHDDGPLKDILPQLESVHLQANHYLTQLVQKFKPVAPNEGKSYHHKF